MQFIYHFSITQNLPSPSSLSSIPSISPLPPQPIPAASHLSINHPSTLPFFCQSIYLPSLDSSTRHPFFNIPPIVNSLLFHFFANPPISLFLYPSHKSFHQFIHSPSLHPLDSPFFCTSYIHLSIHPSTPPVKHLPAPPSIHQSLHLCPSFLPHIYCSFHPSIPFSNLHKCPSIHYFRSHSLIPFPFCIIASSTYFFSTSPFMALVSIPLSLYKSIQPYLCSILPS